MDNSKKFTREDFILIKKCVDSSLLLLIDKYTNFLEKMQDERLCTKKEFYSLQDNLNNQINKLIELQKKLD